MYADHLHHGQLTREPITSMYTNILRGIVLDIQYTHGAVYRQGNM